MKTTIQTQFILFTTISSAFLCAPVFAGDPTPQSSLLSPMTQVKAEANASGDPKLQSLSSELGTKVQALNTSLGTNTQAKSLLQSALASLSGSGSQSTASVSSLQRLSAAKLTPEQTKLAKDVRDVGSAYLVQKNLGSVDGSQSDVAQIVSSLRKGQPAAALPPMKNVASNAKLTQPQKDFLKSLADKYSGLGKAEDTLKKLPSIPGLNN
jgi:hypothetical protein